MRKSDLVASIVVDYYAKFDEWKRDDILHTQEVVSYARMIAVGESMSDERVDMMECAAWLHDIGCPRSKQLYGNSLPVNQQSVGREVAAELLAEVDVFTHEEREWLCDVVGTHHQFNKSLELGFEPLFEADLIVNLLSGYHPRERANELFDKLMTTNRGREIFRQVI